MSELADASALLWRLQLLNVRLGERWQLLADLWQRQTLIGVRPFYIAHAMMALAAAGRTAAVLHVFNNVSPAKRSDASAPHPEDALMLPLSRALLAFAYGDYVGCVGWLWRVRRIAYRCGGSLAQCDLIHLTLIEAAFRARQATFARTLVAERIAWKTDEPA